MLLMRGTLFKSLTNQNIFAYTCSYQLKTPAKWVCWGFKLIAYSWLALETYQEMEPFEKLSSDKIAHSIMAQKIFYSKSSRNLYRDISFTVYLSEKLISVGLSAVISFGLGIFFTTNFHQNQVQRQNVTCLRQGDSTPLKTDKKIKLNIQMEKQTHSN